MKKISCIIPTYNQVQYISDCIQSVVHQTYPNVEIIIINDGSQDGTREYLDNIALLYNNIQVIHNETNIGLPKTLNVGLQHCHGDYITWISSDCIYALGAFEVMAQSLDDHPTIGLVSTMFRIFGSRNEDVIIKDRIYTWKDMKVGNFVGCCFLFRKECVQNVGEFDPDMLCVEDWDYWMRISLKYPLMKIPGIFAHWRDHSSNLSNTQGKTLGFTNSAKLKEKYRDEEGEYLCLV